MKLEGCSSSFGTRAGTVRLPEQKELETHPVVPFPKELSWKFW